MKYVFGIIAFYIFIFMEKLLQKSVQASLLAGKAILEIYTQAFEVFIKDDASPVTQADLRSSAIIKKKLESAEIPFVSEEDLIYTYSERSGFKRYWLVDPLDGTMEFVKRNDEFTVNIALIEDKKPVMGVIYAPVYDILWFNNMNISYRITDASEKLTNCSVQELLGQAEKLPFAKTEKPFSVLVSRSHCSSEVNKYIENKFRPIHPDLKIESYGSSLKFACLAEGKADAFVCYSKTKEWDTAASEAILLASGGRILRISDGLPLEYSKPDYGNPPFVAYSK
jgi:3''-Phosphoadenosine 5''-phosphosulfate (PAPS) 3''-phosphatase